MKTNPLLTLVLLVTFAVTAPAQDPAEASREAMKKLNWMVGKWKGEGKMYIGPGAGETATVEESIEPRLNGLLFVIDGLGKDKANPDRVVHQAFAILGYDAIAKKYTMRPHLANGMAVDAKVEVADTKVTWGFEVPQTGEIRYTITHTDKDQWNEVGEISRDKGATWVKFFEMTLDRVAK